MLLITYIGHEFLACYTDVFCESGAEHHDLFVVRSHPEDFLDVAAHVYWEVVVIRYLLRHGLGQAENKTSKTTGGLIVENGT